MKNGKPKFSLGQILSTPEALRVIEDSGQSPSEFLSRHAHGDWGEELCEEDRQLNDQSVEDGSRILSAYRTRSGDKICIISEAANEMGQRVATTIILPSQY